MPSKSGIKLERFTAGEKVASSSGHTDGGSLILRYSKDYTTELFRSENKWRFIEPKDGCVIVNVSDSLHKATESSVHRDGHPTPGGKER